ncbi:akuammiline synthase 1-like [Bidens hawaiensis]|uniref:akuammiline synthase 1-like n=1 Tax=Bidens hawaiensis TaxID=980011 RepID=UPI00404A8DA7
MTMIMTRLLRCLRSRQLLTIVSQETIKPSSPTPPHLKTLNLSLPDQMAPNKPCLRCAHMMMAPNSMMRFIFFYKNDTNVGDINILKKSLSKTLASYYPFAGRFLAPSAPKIDCNDQGTEFLEVSNDSRLSDFIFKKDLNESILDQLIPTYAVGDSPNLVEVRLNHFKCGAAALGLSIPHKLGDGFTMAKFFNHWATVARGGCPKNPTFWLSASKHSIKVPEYDFKVDRVRYARRTFEFPNSKLNELKNKLVNVSLVNPTRVEILSSLIFKSAVDAATTLSGSPQPANMHHVVNMREKIIEKNRPEIATGNVCTIADIAVKADYGEMNFTEVIAKLRTRIMEIKEIRDVEELGEILLNKFSTVGDDQSRTYTFSSLCRFPFYQVDFGWGKPVRVIAQSGVSDGSVVQLADTPSGDGIEATVQLKEEEMAIFEKEILAYSQDMI